MDNIKRDEYYLSKMISDLKFIIAHTQNISLEGIKSDEVLLDCIMFRLVQISENSVKLSEGFKMRYKEIPWYAIKGFRNRLVHDYGEVDLSIVYDTVTKDIPYLLHLLEG